MVKKPLFVFVMCLIFISGCQVRPSINQKYISENYNERVRFLVMHYTVGNWHSSLTTLTEEPGGVSSHYLIPENFDASYPNSDLGIYQLVDEEHRAWHAGPSRWEDRDGINDQSIGIELVNNSACYYQEESDAINYKNDFLCFYHDFSPRQIELLISLSKDILARNPDITPTRVIGHSDIQVDFKSDPGAKFPWYTLYQHGIGAWYDDDTVKKYWHKFSEGELPDLATVQCGLKTYGYGVKVTGVEDEQSFDHVRAFQLHFRPWQSDGIVEAKTVAALWALLEKYFPTSIDDAGRLTKVCDLEEHSLASNRGE